MKNRKFVLAFVLILIFSLLSSGCSSDTDMSNDMIASEDYEGPIEAEMDDEEFGETESADGELYEPDKIITTVYIEMQTEDFIPTSENLDKLINKHKGYVENSNISYNDYVYSSSLKYANYTIRIPRESLDSFVDEVVEIGNIISQNKNKEDITKQYRDTESRLRVLETKEERILALLERAEDMEDIIVLENQLSEVIYEKESYTQSLTSMDDQVDYSTVNLSLEEVAKLTAGGDSRTPFLEKVRAAFEDSFYFFTRNAGNLLIGIIYFLPYAIVLGVLGYLVRRFVWKKRKMDLKKDGDGGEEK